MDVPGHVCIGWWGQIGMAAYLESYLGIETICQCDNINMSCALSLKSRPALVLQDSAHDASVGAFGLR